MRGRRDGQPQGGGATEPAGRVHEDVRGDLRRGAFGEAASRLWGYLGRLNQLGGRMQSAEDAARVLQDVVDLACELTQARYGALAVFDRAGNVLQFITHGMSEEQRARIPHLPRGRGLLGHLQEISEPLRLDDLSQHPRSSGFPPGHPPMRSFLGIPIRHGTESLGNLYLTEKQGADGFTEDDEVVLVLLVAQAAIAIHNAGLHGEARRRLALAESHGREMALLHSIAQAAVSTSDLQRVLEESLDAIQELTGVDAVEAWVRPPGEDVLELAAQRGESGIVFRLPTLRLGEGLVGLAASTREPVVSSDLAADERFTRRELVEEGFHAFQALPMTFEGEVLGVLCVASRDDHAAEAGITTLLTRAANELAVVLRSTRLSRRIEELAEERGRLLAAAEAERSRLSVLVDTSPVGVLIADTGGRLEYVNREARRILGVEPGTAETGADELEGVEFRRRDGTRVAREDLPLQRVLRARERVRAEELSVVAPDGRETHVLVDAAPVVGGRGTRGAIAILQDIEPLTAQHAAQTALDRYAVRDAIARDLHDDIIQSIYAVGLGLRAARSQDDVTKDQAIERAMTDLTAVIADLRAYIQELHRPPEAEAANLMLERRLQSLLAAPGSQLRWSLEVDLGSEPPPPALERQLYLVARELISNVVRHADATAAIVRLERRDDRVVLEVRDNGRGFDRAAIRPDAIGVRSIEQRFADLGGSVLIESTRGEGTRVVGELPLEPFRGA